ncbi:MAG: hypothetical protein MGF17_00890 [Trichodesmium sp. MAG_R04]|nr:hypothetical protein [Trichodesmium sp. MAG_R04]
MNRTFPVAIANHYQYVIQVLRLIHTSRFPQMRRRLGKLLTSPTAKRQKFDSGSMPRKVVFKSFFVVN